MQVVQQRRPSSQRPRRFSLRGRLRLLTGLNGQGLVVQRLLLRRRRLAGLRLAIGHHNRLEQRRISQTRHHEVQAQLSGIGIGRKGRICVGVGVHGIGLGFHVGHELARIGGHPGVDLLGFLQQLIRSQRLRVVGRGLLLHRFLFRGLLLNRLFVHRLFVHRLHGLGFFFRGFFFLRFGLLRRGLGLFLATANQPTQSHYQSNQHCNAHEPACEHANLPHTRTSLPPDL